ncbi:MAG: hypothetical protein JXR94_03060 [Candidatus Hydrogenedentes bacterium]|nr:hypothetical protein [Candidatus Hydrogenedentota bacterium]
MWGHVRTLCWLQFVRLRHSLSKPTKALSLALAVLVALGVLGGGVLLAVLFFLLGWRGLSAEDSLTLIQVLDGIVIAFVFFWLLALSMELQRTDIIDLRKMLYLPVSLRTVFLLNFLTALIKPGAVLFILPAFGLTLGLALGRGARMLWAAPLAVAFLLMIGAWTYYIRGFLAALMENKRRRRLILVMIPLVFVVGGQLPNLIVHGLRHGGSQPTKTRTLAVVHTEEEAERVVEEYTATERQRALGIVGRVNAWVPLGWLPLGVYGLAEREPATAGLCFLGLVACTALPLGLGYRSTVRYYTAASGRRRRAKAAQPRRRPGTRRRLMVERGLPLAGDDTAGCAWAMFVNYVRHPQIRMALIMPIVLPLIFYFIFFRRIENWDSPFTGLIVPMAPLFCLFTSSGWICNVFGADGEGFRSFILAPTPRHRYLLAKNLAFLPFLAMPGLVFIGVLTALLRPGPGLVAVAVLQIAQAYFAACIVGNLLSLLLPWRIRPETMRTPKRGFLSGAGPLLFLCIMPVFAGPTLIAAGADTLMDAALDRHSRFPFGVAASVLFLALTLSVYRLALGPTGRLLLRREPKILDALIRDKE